MKLIQVVLLASISLIKTAYCAISNILSNDRYGAAESFLAVRTVDDAMYDGILRSTNEADIRVYFGELGGDAVAIHAPSILLKAISKGNKIAVDTLISLGADPFKKHKSYNMTAWDFLSVIPETELSPGQLEIKMDLQARYMNQPEMRRTLDAINSMKSDTLRYTARFADLETYKKIVASLNLPKFYNTSFVDGSRPLHQTVIGNNLKLFTDLLGFPDLLVNSSWEKGNATIDIQQIMTINPVGWTALMLAIEFYRLDMVKKLLQHPNIDVSVKAGNLDAFTLARRLPEEKRMIILSLLKAKLKNVTVPADCSSYANLKDTIVKGATAKCLSYFLNKETINLDTLVAAVTNVTDMTFFDEILAEAESIIKTDRSVHKRLWTALKSDVKSGTMEKYKEKITKLIGRGFKLEDRLLHVDNSGGVTPVEESLTSSNVKNELALATVLSASNINVLDAREAPIL